MYPFHCHGVACAGINPRILEDVCPLCMPLHKFRANCTCNVARRTTPALVLSQFQPIFPSFPRFVLLISLHLQPSLITVPPCRPSAPRGSSTLPEGRYIYHLPHLPPFLFVHTSIRRSLRAATSNYSNASRVQRG